MTTFLLYDFWNKKCSNISYFIATPRILCTQSFGRKWVWMSEYKSQLGGPLIFSPFGILNSEWLASVCMADLRDIGRNPTIGNSVFGPVRGCELPGVKID